jgi:hypothetical protein
MGVSFSQEVKTAVNIAANLNYAVIWFYIIYGKYLFCHARRWFGPYYTIHHTFCDSTLKNLIPLIILPILKYYPVPNKAPILHY